MAPPSALEEWATWLFSPAWSAILLAVAVAIALPVIFHWVLYRPSTAQEPPCFVLAGPSGSGKTALFALLAHGSPCTTHTSQEPHDALCPLPSTIRASEDKYRSENDNAPRTPPQFRLVDTPGHGKLRHHALSSLTSRPALKGVLFVVDSAALSSAAGLAEAAEFLHDVLLALQQQRRAQRRGASRSPSSMPVLVAANKQDVFTALPTALVTSKLEQEIASIRHSRSHGVVDSALDLDADPAARDDEPTWLGAYGSRDFAFSQLRDHGVPVTVAGGNVTGDGGRAGNVDAWWLWIREHL